MRHQTHTRGGGDTAPDNIYEDHTATRAITPSAKKLSISLPPVLLAKSRSTIAHEGYPSFSAYIQDLIRKDQQNRPAA